MGTKSKDGIRTMVAKDMMEIYNRSTETKQTINDSLKNFMEYLHSLIAQIPHSTPGPLIPKTPKTVKKKGVQRIETIPEDDVVEYPKLESATIKTELNDTENIRPSGRVKREASKKAETNIRKQQSLSLHSKLRRPSNNEFEPEIKTKKRESRAKRKKLSKSSSDEEDNRGPSKHSRIDDTITTSDSQKHYQISNETVVLEQKQESPIGARNSDRKRSSNVPDLENNKTFNMGDDTFIAPIRDDIDEPSMYEDAMSKPVPIMNSTMNINGATVHKMMNATVVLEPLSNANLNMTVTIQKKVSGGSRDIELETQQKKHSQKDSFKSPRKTRSSSMTKTLQDRKQENGVPIVNNIDDLLTDDESSPEIKKTKYTFKKPEDKKKRRKAVQTDSSSGDDSISPPRKIVRAVKKGNTGQDAKNGYKSNALFSPYAKESVKKRVEAFEQAGLNSPKPAADINAPTRLTRTKTRALAAAQAEAGKNVEEKERSIAQQLARKSLAKAKRISLAKEFKDTDDYKENLLQSTAKPSRLVSSDKANSKQHQKTTPLGKTKTLLPMSVNRIQHTPSNHHIPSNHTKTLSATRSNIVTSMDSFLQSKTASKSNSVDKLEEKKRKANDEDVRKKREETLRLQTEEKKRKREEKELKNKLAREAKEKLEIEKRQRAEKEREEKARMAQQQLEKQREEMEKKRLLQVQRIQEKEEKRRLEEQHRQLRLKEQEEAERLLAEQRRREQEAERRREAEVRAQQQAAAEAMRLKQQILAAQAKQHYTQNKKHEGPTNYILDSEPDDDESDDENRPKHAIPYWSQSHIRRGQLEMQRYIPMYTICKFFDAKKSTPDLTEFFHGIDRNRLKRTSSAIWKTPPRYSMME